MGRTSLNFRLKAAAVIVAVLSFLVALSFVPSAYAFFTAEDSIQNKMNVTVEEAEEPKVPFADLADGGAIAPKVLTLDLSENMPSRGESRLWCADFALAKNLWTS